MKTLDYTPVMEAICRFDKIIVMSHKEPDYDALGSQLGLYLSLKKSYPQKDIVAIGEGIGTAYNQYFSPISTDDFRDALVLITDTGAFHLVSNPDCQFSKKTIVIDHHFSRESFADITLLDETAISVCLMIYELIRSHGLYMDQTIAELLLLGIVADSGRFRYKNTDSDTFRITSALLAEGVDLQYIYGLTSKQALKMVRYKGLVMNNFKVYNQRIAYMIHTKEMIETSQLSVFDVGRGTVGCMADIEGIDAWVNFTETEVGIQVELRSKEKPVISVAKSLGGGGHELACGATLESLDGVDQCLEMVFKAISS